MTIRAVLSAVAIVASLGIAVRPSYVAASGLSASSAVTAPAGLNVTAKPSLVDVGQAIDLTVSAKHFPTGSKVTVSFVSAHHGFTGPMRFMASCSCFRLAVALAQRKHTLEGARVTATVKVNGRSFVRRNRFEIRGLAPDGKHFSPGGTPYLAGWVSDPQPLANGTEHFCAWTRALDAFPIIGKPVTFVAHLPKKSMRWFAGFTGPNGVKCSSKSITGAHAGASVLVDIYAGKLHKQTRFTPRS